MIFALARAVCLRLLCAAALSLILSAKVLAVPAGITPSQLYHMQWTIQDGAPIGVAAIAMTRDGYIWLAANGRLFRFDGIEFERIERVGGASLPTERIYSLWARPQGGLWISYVYGGASFINNGRVRNYFMREGLPPNTLAAFAEDGMGNMWASTTRGLMRLSADRWSSASGDWNVPATFFASSALLDPDGTLWILGREELLYLRRGSARFELGLRLPPRAQALGAELISSADGAAWLMGKGVGLATLRTPAPGQPVEPGWRQGPFAAGDSAVTAMIDKSWHLWVATSAGVVRVPLDGGENPARTDTNVKANGPVALAGTAPVRILQDQEDNVWIISNGGLDKFRSSAFVPVPLPSTPDQLLALTPGDDGSVWISTGAWLHRVEGTMLRESLLAPVPVEALHRDRQGTLWVGGVANSIWHRRAGQWIEWNLPAINTVAGIQAIASAPDGAVWVSVVRAGVYRVVDNHWTLWSALSEMPREPATALTFDTHGRLWLGYVNGRVAVLEGDRVNVYGAADGLTTGAVQAIEMRRGNVWIGGERGVSWFDGRSFHPFQGAGHFVFVHVNGIVEKADGDLWLNSTEGAVHIPAAEVRRFVADPSHTVQFSLHDYLDGMPGASSNIRPLPSAAESTDGRLWLASTKGAVSLAPERTPPNRIVPNVYIKSITVDGRRHDVEGTTEPLQLPTNPRELQIAYTATSFAIPERVRFKYVLEGTHMGWQEVGTRREAFFTELPPGTFRFTVIACNDAGIWNETGATVSFVVPPTFLQSRAFIVLCVASASLLLWLLFLLRMRQIKAQLRFRSEERLLERERIARDLHDTFLQGVQGLMLRFQTATERIPASEPARRLMEDALDRADRVLAEGRDKVGELRDSMNSNLQQELAMAGSELSHDHSVGFSFEVEGMPRPLNPLVQEEACRVGIEALTNAFRHAKASHIRATVHFGRRHLGIKVIDDGSGFDASKDKPGRWGQKGMRERARRIRGRLHISSQLSEGTTVELLIPAKLAYKQIERRRFRWLKRLDTASTEEPS